MEKGQFAESLKAAQEAMTAAGIDVKAAPGEPVAPADAKAFAKVQAILDPNSVGPVLITAPIRGKVYVFTLPKWGSTLAMQATVTAQMPESSSESLNFSMMMISIMMTACWGWYPASKTTLIETVRANITDPTKWPPPKPVGWLTSKDPYINLEVNELVTVFNAWREEVIPTKEELEGYYATAD